MYPRITGSLTLQVGFIGGICLPCYDLLVQVLPETAPMQEQCSHNLNTWKEKAADRKKREEEEEAKAKEEKEEEEEEPGEEKEEEKEDEQKVRIFEAGFQNSKWAPANSVLDVQNLRPSVLKHKFVLPFFSINAILSFRIETDHREARRDPRPWERRRSLGRCCRPS